MTRGDRTERSGDRGTVARTRPYPWPFDSAMAGPGTVLLVTTAAGTTVGDEVDARLDALATALRASGGAVVAATTCLDGVGRGPRPVDPAPPAPAGPVDHLVAARKVDAFYGTDLDLVLATLGAQRLLLAGAPLETSVHSTLRSANDRGLECLLLEDAVVAHDLDLLEASFSTVEMSGGIFGAVGRSTDVVAALTSPPPPAVAASRKDHP